MQDESTEFLTEQIITYLGNKRALITNIEKEIIKIKEEMGVRRVCCADLFSGSGVVARMLKKHSHTLIVNDLEAYSKLLNECYLTNKTDYSSCLCAKYHSIIEEKCNTHKIAGIITQNYAPKDDHAVQKGERVFYTRENALLIDTYRQLIDDVIKEEDLKKFFLAPLIVEASIHVNTSGVFKGFYKNKHTGIGCFGGLKKDALTRICGKVELKAPVFSNFESDVKIYQEDTVELSSKLRDIDIAYLDPPYNQHPYGSNYFMLNLIIKNRLDVPVSKVSGITQDWNRSSFNKSALALSSMEKVILSLASKYVIISYNSEGFISFDEMQSMLKKYGSLKTVEIKYNTFRGSRNLHGRDIHVKEYLFVLKK